MKRIVIVFLLIAAVCVGTPFWVGKQIEERLPEYLQRAAQVGQFNIELTSYERDLFRSHAVTTLTFHGIQTEQLILEHSIWHGPLPIGQTRDGQWQVSPSAAIIETTLSTDAKQSGTLGDLLEILPGFGLFHNLTVVSMSGSASSRVTIPSFTQEYTEGGNTLKFEWGGLSSHSTMSRDLTHIDSETKIAGIKFTDPSSESEIKNIASSVRVHEDPSGLLLGNVTIDSDAITFGPRGRPPEFSIKGFQLRNAAKLNGVTVSYAIEVATDEITHPTISFAPAGFEVLFSRLDAATILAVQHQLQKLQTSVVDLSEHDMLQQISDIYIAALPALLEDKPEISLNYLRAQNMDGEVWAKGKLTLSNESNSPITLNNISRLIQAEGEAQISGDLLLSVVRQNLQPGMESAWQAGQFGDISEEELKNMIDTASQQQIGSLVLQGMLIYDGKDYNINFSYRDQLANLNGKPLAF